MLSASLPDSRLAGWEGKAAESGEGCMLTISWPGRTRRWIGVNDTQRLLVMNACLHSWPTVEWARSRGKVLMSVWKKKNRKSLTSSFGRWGGGDKWIHVSLKPCSRTDCGSDVSGRRVGVSGCTWGSTCACLMTWLLINADRKPWLCCWVKDVVFPVDRSPQLGWTTFQCQFVELGLNDSNKYIFTLSVKSISFLWRNLYFFFFMFFWQLFISQLCTQPAKHEKNKFAIFVLRHLGIL